MPKSFFSILAFVFSSIGTAQAEPTIKKFTCPDSLPAMGSTFPFSKATLVTKKDEMIEFTCDYDVPCGFVSIWLPKGTTYKFSNEHQWLVENEETMVCTSNNVNDCAIEYIPAEVEWN